MATCLALSLSAEAESFKLHLPAQSLATSLSQVAQQAVQAATEAHRVARNRYEGGLARYLDVLSAEDQLLASVRQLVDVQSRALTLDIGLHRALGGGWSESAGAPDATAPKA